MEVVYVRWLDASGIGGPVSLATARNDHLVEMNTAGILVGEDEQRIVLAQDWWSYIEDDAEMVRVRDREVIPKAMVLSLQRFNTDMMAPLPSLLYDKAPLGTSLDGDLPLPTIRES